MSSISENRSRLKEFLASIATIRGDLSNITAPPFLLANKSTVELPQYWAEHPSILVAPAAEADPQKRALLVLKWFLSALKNQQYAGRSENEGVKKPLNAFLGEVFLAQWEDESGVTKLVSEQVSHHPPVTACYLWNDEHGVRAEGYTCQEITFNGSVNIKQIGHAILHLDKWDEDFLIPLPNVRIKGILSGAPYPELSGIYYLASSSGFVSEIDFSGRGFFSGTKNSFEAKLYRAEDPKNILYSVVGQWNDRFTIRSVQDNTDLEIYDTVGQPCTALQVPDVSEQDPWESRNAWGGVISALNRGDMRATSDAKSVVERGQRNMRKEEESKGEKWRPVFFTNELGDKAFEKLAGMVGARLEADKTMGVWKVDKKVVENAKKPYHGDLTPTGGRRPSGTNQQQVTESEKGAEGVNGLEDKVPSTPAQGRQLVEEEKRKEADEKLERAQLEDFLRDKYKSSRP